MGMPYMGQSFPRPKGGGGLAGAGAVFGMMRGVQQFALHKQLMDYQHQQQKDLIDHKVSTQSAADLLIGGQESFNRKEETTHKEKEARKTTTHKSKRNMKEKEHGVDEDVRLEREKHGVGLDTLRTMTSESRPGVDENGRPTPPKIDNMVVRSPLEFQATGATKPKGGAGSKDEQE